MLKGINNGVLIDIKDFEKDIKTLEEKISGSTFLKDTPFFLNKKDMRYFNLINELLSRHGYKLMLNFEDKVNEDVDVGKMGIGAVEAQFDDKKETRCRDQEEKCLIIRRTLRSGQRIEFDENVIVLGEVNPGAEVLAGGDIYVFGNAMGLLHAGKNGDRRRCIIALKLNVIQIRIADIYAKSSKNYSEYDVKQWQAEKASLDENNNLVIQEYKSLD